MSQLDGSLKGLSSKDPISDLPPVRAPEEKKVKTEKEKKKTTGKKTSVKPKDHQEWDKFDIEGELHKIDDVNEKENKQNAYIPNISEKVDISPDCLEETKNALAVREKEKGNEAFRSCDYNEAVTYYNRSLSINPLDVVYNNRALAYLKLHLWEEAILDCNRVLQNENNNIKALLRRASAYKEKKEYNKAVCDLKNVLTLEPENQRAKQILTEVEKCLDSHSSEETNVPSSKKGRKMIIEEVDGSEDTLSSDVNKNLLPNGLQAESNGETETLEKSDEVKTENLNISEACRQNVPKCSEKESKQRKNIQNKLDSKTCVVDNDKYINSNDFDKSSCSSQEGSQTTPTGDLSEDSIVSELAESPPEKSSPEKSNEDSSPCCDTSEKIEIDSNPICQREEHTPKVFTHWPLDPKIASLKNSGNDMFLRGRYAEALKHYTNAINLLEEGSADQVVNLSLIYSNRAACSLKMGQCRDSIADCTKSLQLVPHSVKSLLRRAVAYETLEKYGLAYIDYKHVLSIDGKVDSSQQGSSRCSQTLIQQHGYTWRDKLPPMVQVQSVDIPVIQQPPETSSASAPSPDLTQTKPSEKTSNDTPAGPLETEPSPPKQTSEKEGSTPEKKTPKPVTKEEEFEQLKAQGNKHVKNEEYLKAVDCYTRCIQLFPDKVVSFTNRALCYLKLNQASKAASDCDKSLDKEPENIKAMFRRAQAKKLMKNYRASLSDLKNLLKMDPKNSAAKKELEVGKNLWRQELNAMKASMSDSKSPKSCNKCSQESGSSSNTSSNSNSGGGGGGGGSGGGGGKKGSKQRNRLHVHDVDDESQSKSSTKSHGKHHKNFASKKSEGKVPENSQSSNNNSSTKKGNKSNVRTGGPAPVSAPHIDKATPYEFLKAWNSFKSVHNTKPYADLLAQVPPEDLPKMISNKLDASMLNLIIRCVSEHYADRGTAEVGVQILSNLTKAERFQTIAMFMSSKDKSDLTSLVSTLATNQSVYGKAEILTLRQDYGLK